MRKGLLIGAALLFCALTFRGLRSGYLAAQTRSQRIHEILQKAQRLSPEDEQIRTDLQQVLSRKTGSFPEFQKQCTDLQSVLSRSDAMEKQKREMLSELRVQFQGDQKVQPVFDTLHALEALADKKERVWGEMISCSRNLAVASKNQQDRYRSTCVEPANLQTESLTPEVSRLADQLRAEIQSAGGDASDLLRALGN